MPDDPIDPIHYAASIASVGAKRDKEGMSMTAYTIVTGCGQIVAVTIPTNHALITAGFSGWAADLTCPECMKRQGLWTPSL